MRSTDRANSRHCSTCTITKQCTAPIRDNLVDHSETTIFHVDMLVPITAESFGRKRFSLTMVTAPHQYVRAHLMGSREDIAEHVYNFVARTSKNAEYKTKRRHCGHASEFIALRK